ncbi:MAG TPA: hypothetical protein VGR55_05545 [Candidatus Acidoferrum sp.]|nr:hypothetical protein [Candidatus Acidoferrum sp.]
MNQQSTNSSFTNNSSASSNLAPLVTPGSPQPKEAAATDAPLPKAVTRRSKSTAIANERKATAVAKNEDRCRHYTSTGRRCRLGVLDPASGLCFRHVGLQFQPSDEDLLPAFGGLLSKLQSACGIHDFLSQLTVLLVQNRISTRRAAILAYLGQTLLRTLPAIEEELQPEQPPFVFDLPRPKRDDDISPERAFVEKMSKYHTSLKEAPPAEPDGYDGWSSNLEQTK